MTSEELKFEDKYLSLLKKEVIRQSESLACKIMLFGSRARGQIKRSSDYDIAVEGLSEEEFFHLSQGLQSWWQQSMVPHKIDMSDWNKADENFRKMAGKDTILWKTC
jgi:predicted nucleotidyltransferase